MSNLDAAWELEQHLAGLPLGGLRYFSSIGSTNTEASAWADAGAADLSLAVADEQTAGRGRGGRRWFTPPGAALAFSLVLRPGSAAPPADLLARYTALGGLAVADALQQAYGLPAQVKWPNDVLIERRKVCGVLTEAQWTGAQLSALVLGIGVNVSPAAAPPPGELLYPAACVETALGRPLGRWALLRAILDRLIEWRARLDSPQFWRAWDERLAFKGEWVQVADGLARDGADAAAVQDALVLGLDEQGGLRLQDRQGSAFTLTTGELRLRPGDW